MVKSRMYAEAQKRWSPFAGCNHNCIYCKPSFQRQAKRQRKNCALCYDYTPHEHPERLKQYIPKTKQGEFIFTCSQGDISFASWSYFERILHKIEGLPDRDFLIQSKNPACYLEHRFPSNVILGATIETNRDELCREISNAPLPSSRYNAMLKLNHSRKLITIEPILDFDLHIFLSWIRSIAPKIVYIGYDNHNCKLIEPSITKVLDFISHLEEFTEVRRKTLRKVEETS